MTSMEHALLEEQQVQHQTEDMMMIEETLEQAPLLPLKLNSLQLEQNFNSIKVNQENGKISPEQDATKDQEELAGTALNPSTRGQKSTLCALESVPCRSGAIQISADSQIAIITRSVIQIASHRLYLPSDYPEASVSSEPCRAVDVRKPNVLHHPRTHCEYFLGGIWSPPTNAWAGCSVFLAYTSYGNVLLYHPVGGQREWLVHPISLPNIPMQNASSPGFGMQLQSMAWSPAYDDGSSVIVAGTKTGHLHAYSASPPVQGWQSDASSSHPIPLKHIKSLEFSTNWISHLQFSPLNPKLQSTILSVADSKGAVELLFLSKDFTSSSSLAAGQAAVQTGRQSWSLPRRIIDATGFPISCMAWCANSRFLALGTRPGWLSIYDGSQLGVIQQLSLDEAFGSVVGFSFASSLPRLNLEESSNLPSDESRMATSFVTATCRSTLNDIPTNQMPMLSASCVSSDGIEYHLICEEGLFSVSHTSPIPFKETLGGTRPGKEAYYYGYATSIHSLFSYYLFVEFSGNDLEYKVDSHNNSYFATLPSWIVESAEGRDHINRLTLDFNTLWPEYVGPWDMQDIVDAISVYPGLFEKVLLELSTPRTLVEFTDRNSEDIELFFNRHFPSRMRIFLAIRMLKQCPERFTLITDELDTKTLVSNTISDLQQTICTDMGDILLFQMAKLIADPCHLSNLAPGDIMSLKLWVDAAIRSGHHAYIPTVHSALTSHQGACSAAEVFGEGDGWQDVCRPGGNFRDWSILREACPCCGSPILSESFWSATCSNGHYWDRCTVTLLLIQDLHFTSCHSCQKKRILSNSPLVKTSTLLSAMLSCFDDKGCVYCGHWMQSSVYLCMD